MHGPDSAEQAAYHAVIIATDASYAKLSRLRAKHGSWRAASKSLAISEGQISASLKNMNGIRLILREDDAFPALLREIPLAPWGIYTKGTLPPADMALLAIVGTRKATESGRALAQEFAKEISGAGAGIVSGLALGVDAEAHRGALAAGAYTCAVLANGLSRIYPRTNTELGERILGSGGALISEYPPESEVRPYRFLERNRIVSGLSRGVLIVEASERSGSLATSRFALDQNRDVFVLPGPARHPNYAGSHRLIREGAELVTRPADILQAFGLAPKTADPEKEAENDEELRILGVLRESGEAASIDKIIELTHLETHVVLEALSFLIIRGSVREEAAGYVIA